MLPPMISTNIIAKVSHTTSLALFVSMMPFAVED
jgi:hypothetical protein